MIDKEKNTSQLTNAQEELDNHIRAIISWHFSSDTGTPYWREWAQKIGFDPLRQIMTFDDLIRNFPSFDDSILRDLSHAELTPKAYSGRPFKVFETGGTTGIPKQRISWNDHLEDYSEFSNTLDDAFFPIGSNWLMLGPTGPRRLRLSIEHLANIRGGCCFFVDLDPRWVKRLIADKQSDQLKSYKDHVIEQALTIIRNREVRCLFTTPLLLEALAEKLPLPESGISGIFCGGTTMTRQTVRFILEEVIDSHTRFVPTYGNTLMGLACSIPLEPADKFSVTYWAPQPRAVLRVVEPSNANETVAYGSWGRVELTTLTKEFFMPRFLERDEGLRRPPCDKYPWDGVGDVRPYASGEGEIVEGVY